MLTHERLKEIIHYDPDTGAFTSLVNRGKARIGKILGTVRPDGRIFIGIDGNLYLAHRLAHFYMTEQWPEADIDHIDGNPQNNVWNNLRTATRAQNCANRGISSNNKTGHKGITTVKNSKGVRYRATITLGGRTRSLGKFETFEEAADVYRQEAANIAGAFAGSFTRPSVDVDRLDNTHDYKYRLLKSMQK